MSETMFLQRQIDPIKLSLCIKRREVWVENFEDDDLFFFTYYLNRIIELDKRLKVQKKKPINIIISTDGGLLDNCMGMIGKIMAMQKDGYMFKGTTLGKCYSAGFFLLISTDIRESHKYDKLMLHESRNFQHGMSTHIDKVRDFEESKKIIEELLDYVSERTNINREDFRRYIDMKNDWFMGTAEALQFGVIHAII